MYYIVNLIKPKLLKRGGSKWIRHKICYKIPIFHKLIYVGNEFQDSLII